MPRQLREKFQQKLLALLASEQSHQAHYRENHGTTTTKKPVLFWRSRLIVCVLATSLEYFPSSLGPQFNCWLCVQGALCLAWNLITPATRRTDCWGLHFTSLTQHNIPNPSPFPSLSPRDSIIPPDLFTLLIPLHVCTHCWPSLYLEDIRVSVWSSHKGY